MCPTGKAGSGGSCNSCSSSYAYAQMDHRKCATCCVQGSYANEDTSECTPCPEATYSSAGSTNYNQDCNYAIFSVYECSLCPRGYTSGTSSKARGDCVGCAPGKYSPGAGKPCLDCPAGSYQDEMAQYSCTSCPAGQTSPTSTVSQLDCYNCVPGKYSQLGSGCLDCPVGTYGPDTAAPSAGSCKACPAGNGRIVCD